MSQAPQIMCMPISVPAARSPGPFNIDTEPFRLGPRWEQWIREFEIMIGASGITDDTQKRCLLLNHAGSDVQKVFYTLSDSGDTYDTAKRALNSYFIPKANKVFERFQFRHITRKEGESVDQFHMRLKRAAVHCEYKDQEDVEMLLQVLVSCKDSFCTRAFVAKWDLETTLENLKAKERAEDQSQCMKSANNESDKAKTNSDLVFKVSHKPGKYSNRYKGAEKQKNTGNSQRFLKNSSSKCRGCGNDWPHPGGQSKCPAHGVTCRKCNGRNHFAKHCLKKQVSSINEDTTTVPQANNDYSSDSDDYVYHLECFKTATDCPKITVLLNRQPVSLLIDSGSDVNLIDFKTFQQITPSPKLTAYNSTIKGYPDTTIPVKGLCTVKIKHNGVRRLADFVVIDSEKPATPILGFETASRLDIIRIYNSENQTRTSTAVPSDTEPLNKDVTPKKTTDIQNCVKLTQETVCDEQCPVEISYSDRVLETPQLLTKYDKVFHGIGLHKSAEIKLHIDSTVTPVAQKHRRIPFNLQTKVEEELKRLKDADVIEDVTGPTDWVTPPVITTRSNGKVRFCLDMRIPNTAIKRTRHPVPTVDEIAHSLNGSTMFSKIDLRDGYHQIPLEVESRYITTFSTHKGLMRYKRLNYGTRSAAEEFHEVLRKTVHDIPGVLNIHDDIIIFGKTKNDHQIALQATLQRLLDCGLTLNKDKCLFNSNKIEFFGFVFTERGLSPAPSKVEALQKAQAPQNVSDLRSFLGMCNYSSRFISNFSSRTAVLRELLVKNRPWKWTTAHQVAFQDIQNALSTDTIMTYYDTQRETHVHVDGSPFGLGAMISQVDEHGNSHVVAYSSRTLTETEQRYTHIEREALAIVFGCLKFRTFLYGKSFIVYSDHEPLQSLFNNPKTQTSLRIERLRLKLLGFDFKVKYRPGKDSVVDYFSRHPLPETDQELTKPTNHYVHYIINHLVPDAVTIDEIRSETQSDENLSKLVNAINCGAIPSNHLKDLKAYCRIFSELAVVNGLILKGEKIVLPNSLKNKVLTIAHEGHMGIIKTKQYLRSRVWFPGLDKEVETLVNSCPTCQICTPTSAAEPVQMTNLPDAPWQKLSLDFGGPFPCGKYVMAVMDDYSRFPVVQVINSTSANCVIPRFNQIISEYGTPLEIRTDNDPPFSGNDFSEYAKHTGFVHRKITPLYPKANGEIEKFMNTMNKAIRSAHTDGLNWKQELFHFLRNYRASPHLTTGTSPYELLFGRKMNTNLPVFHTQTNNDFNVRSRDAKAKHKMKKYADSKNYVQSHNHQIGDLVLLRQAKSNKLSTPYEKKPYKIVSIKGSMITAKQDYGRTVTRNSSFFKSFKMSQNHKYTQRFKETYRDSDEETYDYDFPVHKPPQQQGLQLRRNPSRNRQRPLRFNDYLPF